MVSSRVLGGEMVALPPCPSPGCFPESGFSDGTVVRALDDEPVPASVQMVTYLSWRTVSWKAEGWLSVLRTPCHWLGGFQEKERSYCVLQAPHVEDSGPGFRLHLSAGNWPWSWPYHSQTSRSHRSCFLHWPQEEVSCLYTAFGQEL